MNKYIILLLILLLLIGYSSRGSIEHFYDLYNPMVYNPDRVFLDELPSISNKHSIRTTNIYNRHDIPRCLRLKIYKLLDKHLFSSLKNLVKPIDIDYLKVSKYGNLTTNYFMEIFLLNNGDYTTNKFIIDFDYNNNTTHFKLNSMRIYNFKSKILSNYSNTYGYDTGSVISRENLKDSGYNPIYNNSPEFSNIDFQVPDRYRNIYDYNNTILPNTITDKSLYATLTPDFYNNNLYTVIDKELFSRTRGMPSFPTGGKI